MNQNNDRPRFEPGYNPLQHKGEGENKVVVVSYHAKSPIGDPLNYWFQL